MKILYAIQTTGNGHFTRAKEIISLLGKRVEVDVVFSGPKNKFLAIDNKVINHYKGLTLYTSKKGQIKWIKTLFKNNFIRAIIDIIQCNTKAYDMVINDYEPITAWSCYLRKRKCVALSNQYAVHMDKEFGKSFKNKLALFFLKYFAPSKEGYGFHLVNREKNIFQPVIRKKIIKMEVTEEEHFLVYLPNYSLEILIQVFSQFKGYTWIIFSPHVKKSLILNNIKLEQLDENKFIKFLVSSKGVISSSGFSTLSEILYLKKPFLTIPINSHIEQIYNSKIIEKLGGTVLKELSLKKIETIQKWLNDLTPIGLGYSSDFQNIVDKILIDYVKSISLNKIFTKTI